MQLISQEVREALPPLYTHESAPDPICTVKYFCPWGKWTAFAYEASVEFPDGTSCSLTEWTRDRPADRPEDVRFFGYVVNQESEIGYWSFREMEAIRGPAGLRIERDLYFQPQPLSVIRARHP